MTDPAPTSIERLRENVAHRVNASSLRAVARQVGMSPSGLEKFLQGGTPYSGTRRKLYNWWLREGTPPPMDLSAEGVAHLLRSMVAGLPAARRDEAMAELLHTLKGLYETQADLSPPWLADLMARWGSGLAIPDPDDDEGEEERDSR